MPFANSVSWWSFWSSCALGRLRCSYTTSPKSLCSLRKKSYWQHLEPRRSPGRRVIRQLSTWGSRTHEGSGNFQLLLYHQCNCKGWAADFSFASPPLHPLSEHPGLLPRTPHPSYATEPKYQLNRFHKEYSPSDKYSQGKSQAGTRSVKASSS